ncbi:MAG: MFS transporter [Anaerolineaceae bacterium]|nr:MFS transporter [Anaerolineaceae bacterium]
MQTFSYRKIFLLGFGFFGVSVIWATYNAYVPLMLDGKFGLTAWWVGVFMVLDNIAALLIQPAVGAWSDRLQTPMGRRLPFILAGAPVGAVLFGFLPVISILPLFVVCAMGLLISMAFWRTPVVALMPDITPSAYRSQANGIINFMGGLGSVISFAVGSMLYARNPNYTFWFGSGLVVVSSALVLLFIREPKVLDEKEQEKLPDILTSISMVFKEEEKSAARILLAIFFWFLSYNAIEAFFTLYGVNHLGLVEADSAFQLTYISLVFLIFALPSGYIGARFGRRRTIMTGIVVMGISILTLYFVPAGLLSAKISQITKSAGLYPLSLILMIAGFAWALININSLPMVVDMTDDVRIGTYTGLYYFASTLAAIAGPVLFGGVVGLSSNNYNLMMLLSPIFLILAWVMMLGVRRGEVKKRIG